VSKQVSESGANISTTWCTRVDRAHNMLDFAPYHTVYASIITGSVTCCTEYHKLDRMLNKKMISIRCHPNYRDKGIAWYDWLFIRFEEEHGQPRNEPCRILSCTPRNNGGKLWRTNWLRVHPLHGVVFQQGLLHCSSNSTCHLCFVMVINPADGSVLVVKDKSLWASNLHETAQTVYVYNEVLVDDSTCQQ
jgi:hypothetical protein